MPVKKRPIPKLTKSDKRRFWSKVSKRAPNECWEWQASKDSRGYGRFGLKYKAYGAHRIAHFLKTGIDGELFVCHHCDNPGCVNPDHMFLGTHDDNIKDAKLKGRMASGDRNGTRTQPHRRARGKRHGSVTMPWRTARGDRNGSRTHPERLPHGDNHHSRLRPELVKRGEGHSNSKLTEDQVREIRAKYKPRIYTMRMLGDEYNVEPTTINGIIKRKSWKHVE